jgi:hypothetical protein
MKFLGIFLVFLPITTAFLLPFSSRQTLPPCFSLQKRLSISVINVSDNNLQILETNNKFSFIKIENISNSNIETVFFRSISLLEEGGSILFDLKKYQNVLLEYMTRDNLIYDFSSMDLNKNTFFWTKSFE